MAEQKTEYQDGKQAVHVAAPPRVSNRRGIKQSEIALTGFRPLLDRGHRRSRHDDQPRPRQVEPQVHSRPRDAQDDGVTAGATQHRTHAMSIGEQRTHRPDRAAVSAHRARRRNLRDEDLAQDPRRGVPVEPECLASALVVGSLLRCPCRFTVYYCLPVLTYGDAALP